MNSQSQLLFLLFVVLLGSARVGGGGRGGQSVISQFRPTLPWVIYKFRAPLPASAIMGEGGGRCLVREQNCFRLAAGDRTAARFLPCDASWGSGGCLTAPLSFLLASLPAHRQAYFQMSQCMDLSGPFV